MLHHPRVLTPKGLVDITVDDTLIVLASDLRGNRETLGLFLASWIALLSDSPITSSVKPLRLYRDFLTELYADARSVILRFADLAHKFVSQHLLMGSPTSIGEWIDEFRDTPVFFEYHRYFQTGDPALVDYLYNFLTFGKKVEYADKQFHDTALRSWLDVEKALGDLVLRDDDPVIISLRNIIAEVLPFRSREFWPKHGPGQTAERTGRQRSKKHNAIAYDPLLDRFFFRGHIGKYGMGDDFGLSSRFLPEPERWVKGAKARKRHPAVLKFVPKSLKTSRSICMEPTTLMFFQQAVWRWMAASIEEGPLGNFIKLSDQSYNRELSLIGSYTSEIDTLDLSSASDRLSWQLAKKVFPPSWRIAMEVTRSREVILPNGDKHVIHKFAPMGSALCFPTQCIVFAAVCIYASYLYRMSCSPQGPWVVLGLDSVAAGVRSFRTPKENFRAALERACLKGEPKGNPLAALSLQPLGVYGDDICCDRRITAYVKAILHHIGFAVNDEKSFSGSQSFRESCGGFYLEGTDVTPVLFRVRGVSRKLTPSQIWSQVALINAARGKGFKRLYSFLLSSLRQWDSPYGKFSIPFVPDASTEFGIKSSSQTNSHLLRRESVPYQRTEYHVWTIRAVTFDVVTHATERYDYVRWLASRSGPSVDDFASSGHFSAVNTRVKRRWTPLY